jgi:hypothetical protein
VPLGNQPADEGRGPPYGDELDQQLAEARKKATAPKRKKVARQA